MDFVEREKPDILCLQETKAHPQQVEAHLLRPMGMWSYWSAACRPGYSGTATYVREPVEHVDYGIGIRKFDSEGRFVVTDHEDFRLYNVYFPNGGMGQERHDFKQEFLVKFLRHLEREIKAGQEIMLVGDYNVAYQDIDVYDPKGLSTCSGFLPEERQWFSEFLKTGFIDLFREFHPQAAHRYTWWSYKENGRMGNRGWRIDHICVTPGLRSRVQSAEILDQQLGSDHCPVMVVME